MTINLRRDAWNDDRQFDDVRALVFEIERLGRLTAERFGSWTPGIAFGGSSTGIIYTTQFGRWSRRGALVLASGVVFMSNNGSATGLASIINLPFVPIGEQATPPRFGTGHFQAWVNTGAAQVAMLVLPNSNGTPTAAVQKVSATTITGADDTDLTNTFGGRFIMSYETNDI